MKLRDPRDLPSCSLSSQCLRLLDELDASNVSVTFLDDLEDERLLEQLREHVPTCPTCTATLAQARRVRAQQRTLLRNALADSEQKVPSTTSQIFAAIHAEAREETQADARLVSFPLAENDITPGSHQLNGKQPPSAPLALVSRPRMILRNALTLAAVAALILASTALFGRLVLMRSHSSVATTPVSPTKVVQRQTGVVTPTTPLPTTSVPAVGKTSTSVPAPGDWNSVLIASISASGPVVSNYDYQSGEGRQLNSRQLPASTRFDGVSPDGKNLLYQYSDGDYTMYFRLSQLPNASFVYELSEDNAGNAIWMDSRDVLIASVDNGVVKVDTQTGQAQAFLPTLRTASILFFHNGFLYFIGGRDRTMGALYRINVDNGMVQQLTFRAPGANFWLSPDGSIVYFSNGDGAGLPGIYSVGSDGTNLHMLRQNGIPFGYAADNSLLMMVEAGNKFEVVKLGATAAQDQVLASDVAPGAVSICDQSVPQETVPICENDIALAPSGHAVVVQAYYADGSHQVFSIDLTTGNRVMLQVPTSSAPAQLIGWDKLPLG